MGRNKKPEDFWNLILLKMRKRRITGCVSPRLSDTCVLILRRYWRGVFGFELVWGLVA